MLSLLQRSLKNPRTWQLILAAYWLALVLGTHTPIQRLALNRGATDKVAHVVAFAGLAFLVSITWRVTSGRRLQLRQFISVWVLCMLYGAIEETTQPMVMRTASLIDWFADALGATLGLVAYWLLSIRLDAPSLTSETSRDKDRPSTWRRYSLQTLFIVMTLVALTCYWLMLPTINAQRFVRALHFRDYEQAEQLFMAGSERFPGSFKNSEDFKSESKIQPLSWKELCNGERRVLVTVRYGNKRDTAEGGATIFAYRKGLTLHPLILSLPQPPSATQ